MVAERDRLPQLGRRRAGDDGQRDLRPHAADGEQVHEQLALLGIAEAVELERVLAYVEVRLDGDLRAGAGPAKDRRRGRDEVADAVHVQDEPVRCPPRRASPQSRDHAAPLTRRACGAAASTHGRSRPRAHPPRGTSRAPPAARAASSPSARPAPCRRGRNRRPPA